MTVDYDTYAAKSPLQKVKILGELTPENKAELVITHWRRWLESNRHRLNDEQIAFLESQIAYITPELYTHPRADEEAATKRSREMENRARALFAFEDFIHLHMGAFKNSGEIRNPVARILAPARIVFEAADVASIDAALCDLTTLPPDQLRSYRYGDDDLATLLARHFPGLPAGEEFWNSLADEDVPLAAGRARALLRYRAKHSGDEPPPLDPQR